MPGKLFHILFLIFWLSGFTLPQPTSPAQATGWPGKIDPWIEESGKQGETEFILLLAEQADLSRAKTLRAKAEKGEYVYRQLVQTAALTQRPLLDFLASAGVEHRSYWIANMVWVRGDMELAHSLALRPDIAHIYANPRVSLDLPLVRPPIPLPGKMDEIEWNLRQVGAPLVWAAGFTGQGVILAGQDTGYEWDHPALKEQYLGWNGSTADHNYTWHDAIHEDTGSPCGADSLEPCDDKGHGTHTMGLLVGEDSAQANRIGMAPGAKWIGCRNMNQGFGTPATYIECFEWFLAPTDLAGENPDPSRAPDVINNSWGCTPEEGCTSPEILEAVVEAVRAAGILVVAAAGNSGPSCRTIEDPPAINEAAFVVGSTDAFDQVSGFSSRGPVNVDGNHRLKPDVSAPGDWIRSSYSSGGYTELSGTSMAGPHVAGLAALLISADPDLRGNVDRLERLIEGSSKPVRVEENCGGVAGSAIPNHSAGWGRINALAAYLDLSGSRRINIPLVLTNR